MKVIVFSGTTEGRIIAEKLASEGADVQVFVATGYGSQEQGYSAALDIRAGRLSAEEMQEAVKDAKLCIDATHPYAKEATENIREACQKEKILYYRVKRRESTYEAGSGVVIVSGAEEAVSWLRERQGNILLATGAKELAIYGEAGAERLYPRVLPVTESIEACERAGIPHRNIIAMQGPFGQGMNEALIRQFDIRYMVTKDSGEPGGFSEKLRAADVCGITAVVITRPDDEGVSVEEIFEIYRRMIS